MLYEGNQIHKFISSSGSGTVINYGSSGSDFLTSYSSGSGSSRQKVTVPTVPVPVPQHWFNVTPPSITSNVNDIETKAQTFRYRSLLSERKQNVLIWSAYYQNESKTFWFGPKKIVLQANLFCFGPKTLGQSKAIWFGL